MKNFKFLSLIVATIIMFTFVQCDDDDDETKPATLPESAVTFLETNYPNATYEVTTSAGPGGSQELKAVLDNGANVSFTKSGEVVYVGGQIATVPASVISDKITTYVRTNYPTASIVEWEKDDDEEEVELSNGIELVFDLDGNFLYSEKDDANGSNDEDIAVAELPESIITFIETYFSEIAYKEVKKEKDDNRVKYEIELVNGFEMDFNEVGELTSISGDDLAIPDGIVPSKITSYVTENYPDTVITDWDLDRRTQEIELSNDVELVFDLDGNFLYKD